MQEQLRALHRRLNKAQRDYILRQQLKAIQKELGDDEGGERAEAEMMRERLEAADLPEEVRKEAERILHRCVDSQPAYSWIMP